MKKTIMLVTTLFVLSYLTACSPEVGSEAWCENLKEKPKGDWTASEAGDFTKHCLFK